MTVTNNFELPLNAESEVALTMTSEAVHPVPQPGDRKVTPSQGIKIDHEAHAEKSTRPARCATTASRTRGLRADAHRSRRPANRTSKHEDFM